MKIQNETKLPRQSKIGKLMKKGSGPYLIIFRERGRKRPDYKVYYKEDITTFFNDIDFLFGDPVSNYEMIIYSVKLKPIFRVEPLSKRKVKEVCLLVFYDMARDGLFLEKRVEDGALIINVDRSLDTSTFGRKDYKRYKEEFGRKAIEELFNSERIALWEQGKEAFFCPACEEVTDTIVVCWQCENDLCENCGIIFLLKDEYSGLCLACAEKLGFEGEDLEPGIRTLE